MMGLFNSVASAYKTATQPIAAQIESSLRFRLSVTITVDHIETVSSTLLWSKTTDLPFEFCRSVNCDCPSV